MKKLLLVLIFIFLLSPAFSLDFAAGGYGGVSMSWFSGKDWNNMLDYYNENYDKTDNLSYFVYSFGLFTEIKVFEKLAVQPEIQFSVLKGGYSLEDNEGSNFEYEETINTLTIPFLIKYKIPAGNADFFILCGPSLIIVLGNVKTEDNFSLSNGDSDEYSSEYIPETKIGTGFSAGLSYKHLLGNGFIMTDLRYTFSSAVLFNSETTLINNIGINIGYGYDF